MTPTSIVNQLWSRGISVSLADEAHLKASPARDLREEDRALLIEHKAELIEFLLDARATTDALLLAASRACDRFNDSPAARADMERECLALSPHLQKDLLDHFLGRHSHPSTQSL